MNRRTFLAGTAAVALAGCIPTRTDFGALVQSGIPGLWIPQGFTARKIATSWQTVPGTSYTWHGHPDGGATFDAGNGEWVYVSNSEASGGLGGVSGIWFTADGSIVNAYRVPFAAVIGDGRVWKYDIATMALTIAYDDSTSPTPRHLSGVDNIVATTTSAFVAEDGGNMEIVGVQLDTGVTHPVIRYDRTGSEMTGPAFSPNGRHLMFSSQRNPGETFMVTGPWHE